jgi:hypothetical protein
MDDQRVDRTDGRLITEQLAGWMKAVVWLGVFCAFCLSVAYTDDMAGRMFGPIMASFLAVVLAFFAHVTCSFLVDLGNEKGPYAYRRTIIVVVSIAFAIWVAGAILLFNEGI